MQNAEAVFHLFRSYSTASRKLTTVGLGGSGGGWGGGRRGSGGSEECYRTGAAAMNVGRGTEPHLRNLPVVVYGWMLTVRVCRRQSVCYAGGDASGSIVAAGTTVRPLAEACIKKRKTT